MNIQLKLILALGFVGEIGLLVPPVAGQSRAHKPTTEHWVSTWATAEQLMPWTSMNRGGSRGGSAATSPSSASSNGALRGEGTAPSAQTAPRGGGLPSLPANFADQTIRMIVRTSVGGHSVRIQVSNMLTANPLDIGAAHIAVHKGGGEIADGTDRVLTFSGSRSFTVPRVRLPSATPLISM